MAEGSDSEDMELNSGKTGNSINPIVENEMENSSHDLSRKASEEQSIEAPLRPNSTISSASTKAQELDMTHLESPIVAGPSTIEEDEEDEEDTAGYGESAERDEIIRERINRTQEQMRIIVDNLSEEQLKRYERFRRVGLARPTMEKLMQRILDQRVNTTSVIVTSGIAKVFVGELIEGARVVMEEEIRAQYELSLMGPEELEEAIIVAMENRPLEPFHIIESHRRMKQETFSAPSSLIYSKPSPFF